MSANTTTKETYKIENRSNVTITLLNNTVYPNNYLKITMTPSQFQKLPKTDQVFITPIAYDPTAIDISNLGLMTSSGDSQQTLKDIKVSLDTYLSNMVIAERLAQIQTIISNFGSTVTPEGEPGVTNDNVINSLFSIEDLLKNTIAKDTTSQSIKTILDNTLTALQAIKMNNESLSKDITLHSILEKLDEGAKDETLNTLGSLISNLPSSTSINQILSALNNSTTDNKLSTIITILQNGLGVGNTLDQIYNELRVSTVESDIGILQDSVNTIVDLIGVLGIEETQNAIKASSELAAKDITVSALGTNLESVATETTLKSIKNTTDGLTKEATLQSVLTSLMGLATEATLNSIKLTINSINTNVAKESSLQAIQSILGTRASEASNIAILDHLTDIASETTLRIVANRLQGLATDAGLNVINTSLSSKASEATLLNVKTILSGLGLEATQQSVLTALGLVAKDSSITGLKTSTDSVKSSVDLVKGSTDAIKLSTDAIKSSTDNVKTSVDGVKTTADSIKTNTDAIKVSTDANKLATDGVRSSVDTTKLAVDGVKSSVDLVKGSTDTVKVSVDTVKAAIDALKTVNDFIRSSSDTGNAVLSNIYTALGTPSDSAASSDTVAATLLAKIGRLLSTQTSSSNLLTSIRDRLPASGTPQTVTILNQKFEPLKQGQSFTAGGQRMVVPISGLANAKIHVSGTGGMSLNFTATVDTDTIGPAGCRLYKAGTGSLGVSKLFYPAGRTIDSEYRVCLGGQFLVIESGDFTQGAQLDIYLVADTNPLLHFGHGAFHNAEEEALRAGRLFNASTSFQNVAANYYLNTIFENPANSGKVAYFESRRFGSTVNGSYRSIGSPDEAKFVAAGTSAVANTNVSPINNRGASIASSMLFRFNVSTIPIDSTPATTNFAGGYFLGFNEKELLFKRAVVPGQKFAQRIGGAGGGLSTMAEVIMSLYYYEEDAF